MIALELVFPSKWLRQVERLLSNKLCAVCSPRLVLVAIFSSRPVLKKKTTTNKPQPKVCMCYRRRYRGLFFLFVSSRLVMFRKKFTRCQTNVARWVSVTMGNVSRHLARLRGSRDIKETFSWLMPETVATQCSVQYLWGGGGKGLEEFCENRLQNVYRSFLSARDCATFRTFSAVVTERK